MHWATARVTLKKLLLEQKSKVIVVVVVVVVGNQPAAVVRAVGCMLVVGSNNSMGSVGCY